jgi:hypothetical protein
MDPKSSLGEMAGVFAGVAGVEAVAWCGIDRHAKSGSVGLRPHVAQRLGRLYDKLKELGLLPFG